MQEGEGANFKLPRNRPMSSPRKHWVQFWQQMNLESVMIRG